MILMMRFAGQTRYKAIDKLLKEMMAGPPSSHPTFRTYNTIYYTLNIDTPGQRMTGLDFRCWIVVF